MLKVGLINKSISLRREKHCTTKTVEEKQLRKWLVNIDIASFSEIQIIQKITPVSFLYMLLCIVTSCLLTYFFQMA